MRRTLTLIICRPYVIISGECPNNNIYSGKYSKNGPECLDDDILQLYKVVSVKIYICVKETVNLKKEAVRSHDQTGGKFSRFDSSDAHFKRSTLQTVLTFMHDQSEYILT
jgi:hypothetical protein